MPATGLKKLARGQQMAEKARHFDKIQLGEHLATNEVNDIRSVTLKGCLREAESLRNRSEKCKSVFSVRRVQIRFLKLFLEIMAVVC